MRLLGSEYPLPIPVTDLPYDHYHRCARVHRVSWVIVSEIDLAGFMME